MKCPLCKEDRLIEDKDFSKTISYWFCDSCHALWSETYLNAFWTGFEAGKRDKESEKNNYIYICSSCGWLVKHIEADIDKYAKESFVCPVCKQDIPAVVLIGNSMIFKGKIEVSVGK